ncbi:MAG: ParB/RepB/Spo0J family partition protein [Scytonematopsis contorta HA4267-MV1]|jgi:hypothetical protein|nr:ParB/RepB/Spo0J family partition protein [Scytonematopsis contorta HA4267-MV1]
MQSSSNHQVIELVPQGLKVHPKLIEIYGDNETRFQLQESIHKHGILTPLQVSSRTGEYVVISGKCRLQIALSMKLESLPAVIGTYANPEDEMDAIFIYNLHREGKTHYQKLIDADYLEAKLRPLAKERQQQGAYIARRRDLLSNLTEAESFAHKDSEHINVRDIVCKSIDLSTGSYFKAKKIFQVITQYELEGSLIIAAALKDEFNRSIDAAYKLLHDDRRFKALQLIENEEFKTIPEALAAIISGFRNPWRKYDVGQVYFFNRTPRSDVYHQARITKITDEFVYFSFRNTKTHLIETISLRPNKINALVCEEPSGLDFERINRLLSKFGGIYPIRLGLLGLLNVVNFTLVIERYLADLEAGGYERIVCERESSFFDSHENCVDFRGQTVPLETNFALA